MSEPVRYMVPKEWSPLMLEQAEAIAMRATPDPEKQAFVLGVLASAWPRLIDTAINEHLERAA